MPESGFSAIFPRVTSQIKAFPIDDPSFSFNKYKELLPIKIMTTDRLPFFDIHFYSFYLSNPAKLFFYNLSKRKKQKRNQPKRQSMLRVLRWPEELK
jgi:hypothetical protein